jgi:hypothetical protein
VPVKNASSRGTACAVDGPLDDGRAQLVAEERMTGAPRDALENALGDRGVTTRRSSRKEVSQTLGVW